MFNLFMGSRLLSDPVMSMLKIKFQLAQTQGKPNGGPGWTRTSDPVLIRDVL